MYIFFFRSTSTQAINKLQNYLPENMSSSSSSVKFERCEKLEKSASLNLLLKFQRLLVYEFYTAGKFYNADTTDKGTIGLFILFFTSSGIQLYKFTTCV